MNIYISGITGTGMGPLALMAKAAGYNVFGSDLAKGAIYNELIEAGVEVKIGEQDGKFLLEKIESGLDWFVHTSALSDTHAELLLARGAGIKTTKRDEFTAFLVEKLGLKMVAVAGTHGKTTTTSMITFAALKLGIPAAYIVGTTLGFAKSGAYHAGDKFFIYEADEYDRNFLKFHPWLSVITHISYDHPDIYPTMEDYIAAFEQFKSQSEQVIDKIDDYNDFKLAGKVRRKDAGFAREAMMLMAQACGMEISREKITKVLDEFPGVGRRFEKIADGLYTDYAHHPEEIAATLDIAKEEAKLKDRKGVVAIYQPHQNVRQHEVRDEYKDAFVEAEKILWLPTYLTRENPELAILTPQDLISGLANKEKARVADLNDELAGKIKEYLNENYLVILLTAGPADAWLRQKFGE